MSNLSNNMEEYLKKLLKLSTAGFIDIRRKELASKFSCVPSQVNYVLETRFTLERGYMVESKRGGRGFLRIRRIHLPVENILAMFFQEAADNGIGSKKAKDLILRLYESKFISFRESRLIEASLGSLQLIKDESLRDKLRGKMLKEMLMVLV
ncbi:MAG: CtsR family transcriptional regulator [Firmicutes bacterium]|nr:CtsR family transcriptional regulator [Bacillota bacterium]